MNVAAVNTRIEGDSPGQNLSGTISFTADDVLTAYVKGKNYLSDEVRTVLSRTIPQAIKRGPQVVNKITQNSGMEIPLVFMKVNGLSTFDILCVVKPEDYLSSAKLRKAYVVASQIEDELFDNSFNFLFRFVISSDAMNENIILSEGYRQLPTNNAA